MTPTTAGIALVATLAGLVLVALAVGRIGHVIAHRNLRLELHNTIGAIHGNTPATARLHQHADDMADQLTPSELADAIALYRAHAALHPLDPLDDRERP